MIDELMSMEHWWNYNDRGKTEVFGAKPTPVPLCSSHIPHAVVLTRIEAGD